jgi:hypothetical protein
MSTGEKSNISSFVSQTWHLQNELDFLGVKISVDDVARISFLGRRKYDRYDHFYPRSIGRNPLSNSLKKNNSQTNPLCTYQQITNRKAQQRRNNPARNNSQIGFYG